MLLRRMVDSAEDDHTTRVLGDKSSWTKIVSAGRTVIKFVLAQWLIIGFGISCLLGYLFPSESRVISR